LIKIDPGDFLRGLFFKILSEIPQILLPLVFSKKRIMSDQKDQNKNQINIEIDDVTAEGTYANLAIINHSVSEFVVDFVSIMPGRPKAKVKSRIILTPQHAKRFLKALSDNVQRFENSHGEIKDYEQPPIPLNFGPTGEA